MTTVLGEPRFYFNVIIHGTAIENSLWSVADLSEIVFVESRLEWGEGGVDGWMVILCPVLTSIFVGFSSLDLGFYR